jgi:hypothetical protein
MGCNIFSLMMNYESGDMGKQEQARREGKKITKRREMAFFYSVG